MSSQFSETDFFGIREKLVEYFSTKPEFSDVNFEGQAISILIDSLAHSIQYMAQYANFTLSESFLDTATLRSSVVSRAKELGFVSSPYSAAQATIRAEYNSSESATILRGDTFVGGTGNQSKSFVVLDDVQFTANGSVMEAEFTIHEGTLYTRNFRFEDNQTNIPKFIISDKNIDITTIQVLVNGIKFSRYDGIAGLDGETKVFFVSEEPTGEISINFGDGVLGFKPSFGDDVQIEYVKTSGKTGNGYNSFFVSSITQTTNSLSISTVSPSSGGRNELDIDVLKHTAKMNHAAQDRATTENDYLAILSRSFPWVETANVWGGEKNNPPEYGKVFISVKPFGDEFTSPTMKQDILDKFQSDYSVLGISIDVVDPDYTYVNVNTTVKFDILKTEKQESEIATNVTNAINDYFNNSVFGFGNDLIYSKLLNAIDSADNGIIGNKTTLKLVKKFTPIQGQQITHTIRFPQEFIKGSVYSKFTTVSNDNVEFYDNGSGVLYQKVNDSVGTAIGTISYSKGEIVIPNYGFNTPDGTTVSIGVSVDVGDIKSDTNSIILTGDISVTMQRV